ncbi:hypothetical protein [Alloactinosynnema sp. L-07]|uniref:hypothetical protein n=1 Tax=Alloactinosynnema sp. L-07 TaxID=1653480 RepID=UPI0015614F79|nr:hypothetical protein [Alloactinosynnema sp. L-07]
MDIDTKVWIEITDYLVLSPPKIWDAFNSFVVAGGEHHNTTIEGLLGEIGASLSEWDGPAAEAFGVHLSNIRGFLDGQRRHLDQLLIGYASAYKLAVLARESWKSLVEEWIEVSRQYRLDDDERRRAVRMKVAAGILAAVAGAATGGTVLAAGIGAMGALTGAAAEEITADLGGDTGSDVWQSYERAYQRLAESNLGEIETIRKFVQAQCDEITAESVPMYEPLPSSTDVDSPDFRYERFFHQDREDGFSRDVAAERTKYVAEKGKSGFRSDGPIALALNGRDEVEDA